MSFLDTLVMPQHDDALATIVYRKPSLTDQYLQWYSHYNISAKYRVVRTLNHRTKAVCSNLQLLQQEEKHLQEVLLKWEDPRWFLIRMKIKSNSQHNSVENENSGSQQKNTLSSNEKTHVVELYTNGPSESFKNTYGKHRIQMYFKEGKSTKTSWWLLKTKITSFRRVRWFRDSSMTGWKDPLHYIWLLLHHRSHHNISQLLYSGEGGPEPC